MNSLSNKDSINLVFSVNRSAAITRNIVSGSKNTIIPFKILYIE